MELLKKLFLVCAIVAFATVAFSCSKTEEEEEEDAVMEGSVDFDCPRYIAVNEVHTMTVYGIDYPLDPSYKWYIDDIYSDTLRSRTVTVQFPDSLGDFSVTAYAEKAGFDQTNMSFTVTTIDTVGERSVTGFAHSGKTILDDRDGQIYQYVTIGNLDWFAQNLAYTGSGAPYMLSTVMHSVFGRYYYWEEATGGVSGSGLGGGPQGACPEGWTVPTNEDWEDLGRAVSKDSTLSFFDEWDGIAAPTSANVYINDERMWDYNPDNDHNNSTGWNAIPAGYSESDQLTFATLNAYGFWWSATEHDSKKGYYRYQYVELTTFPCSFTYKKGIGASVRCVRPAQQ